QAHMLSNKIKKDLKALVPNTPDLRCAIDGNGRSAVAYHITDQVISKEKDAKENPCLWLYCVLCKSG
ncbi:MAG TPA: hypothetical protein VE732_00500, partial [Nitrososphaera sp.]|nr:hypothetical protein [Nitrososphaera sp.]